MVRIVDDFGPDSVQQRTSLTQRARVIIPIFAVIAGVSCRTAAGAGDAGLRPTEASSPQIVQPGAPGGSSRIIDADRAADLSQVQHTEADVRFMQGMIGHHAQALEMSALLPSRTARDEMKLLAKRIEVSQADEIAMMQDWLTSRGQEVPDPHAHHMHGATLMPGMLTAEEMARLAAAKGPEFDRLFLEFMIKHHQGALSMVRDLFSTRGAGQETEIFAFASDVDADQRMEIDRMIGMLSTR